MEKLNLPIIKGPLPPPRSLSMHDYLKFVLWGHKHTFNREAYEYWKEKRVVNVRFSLK